MFRSGLLRITFRRYCSNEVRVRFAPSPTGELHLGGLRTALFNYLYAKRHDGKFLIRIEDTDQTRTVEGCEERIIDDCKWMGIVPDEPIRKQSEHSDVYKEHAEKLIESGHAYRCFCTPDRLKKLRETAQAKGKSSMYDRKCLYLTDEEIKEKLDNNETYTIRMNIPRNEQLIVKDIVYDTIKFECGSLDDQILLKSDGLPTYHLASVVDDHHQGITHVIRGEEWMPSLPKHMLLYRSFQWQPPRFAHLPLLLNPDKSKLSKRQDSSSLNWYRGEGFEKESILSYIAALGWTPTKPDEDSSRYLEMKDLISRFSLDEVSKSGAIVDIKKLYSINSQYLNYLSSNNIDLLVKMFLKEMNLFMGFNLEDKFSSDYIKNVVQLCTSRMRIVSEFTRISYFFESPNYESQQAKEMKEKVWQAEKSSNWMKIMNEKLKDIPDEDFTVDTISQKLNELCEEESVKMGKVFPSFRYALTGSFVGAGIPETIHVLGKETTLNRLSLHY